MSDMEARVLSFLANEIERENIPGAALYVSSRGKKVMEKTIGYRSLFPKKASMQLDTIFDLASLTKIIATMTASLQLLDQGEIRLADRVAYFLPAFAANGKADITIKHLLTHTSGLPAYRRYYVEGLQSKEIINRIYVENLVAPAGNKVIYSDLGFILLSSIIERVTGFSFQEYAVNEIFKPLDMEETGFNLPFNKERFAATEYSELLQDYKCGIVHDENAEVMGGISGHAGLFSKLQDLAKFASMVESGGAYHGKRIVSAAAIELSKKNFTAFDQEARGLGWQMKSAGALACGDLFSDQSYGHTGFTGTSMWFDPQIQLHVILLTNRVHAKNKDEILRLRPRLHNLIRSYF